jgi:hypothetical protein
MEDFILRSLKSVSLMCFLYVPFLNSIFWSSLQEYFVLVLPENAFLDTSLSPTQTPNFFFQYDQSSKFPLTHIILLT